MSLLTKAYGVPIQNETYSAALLHGTICFSIFYKMKFGIFLLIWFLALLRVEGLKGGKWRLFLQPIIVQYGVSYKHLWHDQILTCIWYMSLCKIKGIWQAYTFLVMLPAIIWSSKCFYRIKKSYGFYSTNKYYLKNV